MSRNRRAAGHAAGDRPLVRGAGPGHRAPHVRWHAHCRDPWRSAGGDVRADLLPARRSQEHLRDGRIPAGQHWYDPAVQRERTAHHGLLPARGTGPRVRTGGFGGRGRVAGAVATGQPRGDLASGRDRGVGAVYRGQRGLLPGARVLRTARTALAAGCQGRDGGPDPLSHPGPPGQGGSRGHSIPDPRNDRCDGS